MQILSQRALENLAKVISGEGMDYQRSGPEVAQLFRSAGVVCQPYDQGEATDYAFKVLQRYQTDPAQIEKVILKLSDLKEHKADVKALVKVVNRLNQILNPVGMRIGFDGITPKIIEMAGSAPHEVKPKAKAPPNFHQITRDSSLAPILEWRWREVSLCLDQRAYVAAFVIMGSVLEGTLLSYAQHNMLELAKSKEAPRDQQGRLKSLGEWSLEELVRTASELGWIKIKQGCLLTKLIYYRTLLHPFEQRARDFHPNREYCHVCYNEVLTLLRELEARS